VVVTVVTVVEEVVDDVDVVDEVVVTTVVLVVVVGGMVVVVVVGSRLVEVLLLDEVVVTTVVLVVVVGSRVVDVVVIVVTVVDVVVTVVVVGQPQVKLPGTATLSRMGWLLTSETSRFSMSSATTLPGVQGGMASARRIVMIAPVPGAIDPPPKSTIRAVMELSAETSFAVQTNPEVRLVQLA